MVIRLVVLCIGVVVLGTCTATFPAFPYTPFSSSSAGTSTSWRCCTWCGWW